MIYVVCLGVGVRELVKKLVDFNVARNVDLEFLNELF